MKNVIIKMDFIPTTCAGCPIRTKVGIHDICPISRHNLDLNDNFKQRDINCPIKGEIITCKECRYARPTDNEILNESLLYCTIHKNHVNKNYYCATVTRGEENG